ncbi:chondroadherin-like protein [Gracilinanus agilis]|uniref:chondroadherin-like protein n=1 Tax=Gracilinanus agilis TaxID=191870 RepID=UPI001CFD435D|nr:chondroadherin-like protein [Gracilinanus agilis]
MERKAARDLPGSSLHLWSDGGALIQQGHIRGPAPSHQLQPLCRPKLCPAMWHPLGLPVLLVLAWRGLAGRCPRVCVCDNARRHVSCRSQNLPEVPAGIPQMTQRLDLQGNALKMLPPEAFVALPHLTHLDLRHCQLERVEEGAFRGLGRLLYLNLASNRLSVLYQEALDGLGSLRQLLLEHNRLEEIRPGAFGQLGSLGLLSLAHNSLVYLPDMAFQGLLQARWLRLSHNALNVVAPEALAGLPGLRRLSLDHNELQALPGEALSRPAGLVQLELGHNPLTYVGEEAGLALAALRELSLDHAALQAVGAGAFARCPRLRSLDLRSNQLGGLPPLEGVGRLRKLNLTGNPLLCDCAARPLRQWVARARVRTDGRCSEPGRLQGDALESLRAEDLRCERQAGKEEAPERRAPTRAPEEDGAAGPCPAPCVCAPDSQHGSCVNRGLRLPPSGFPEHTRLLDLRRNNFSSVPRAAFPGLARLVSLHLQDCGIGRLEPGALAGLGQLVYLYLSANRLSALSGAALRGAPRLRYLYLDGNRFTRLPGAALQVLPELFSLHLERNAVRQLALADLAGAGGLRRLYLSGNRISGVAPGPALELEKLHLDGNRLQTVPTAGLEGLPALRELQLSGNPLRALRAGAFLPVAGSLQHLYLNGTGLRKVSPGAFAGLGRELRTLFLDKNRLQTLPAMDGFSRLELITLGGNPFLCDCRLLPLHRWLTDLNLRVGATCELPASVWGQKVRAATAAFEACPGWGTQKGGGDPSHAGRHAGKSRGYRRRSGAAKCKAHRSPDRVTART